MDGNQACLEAKFRGETILKGELQDFPHNCIGMIRFKNIEKATGFGTGFLIGSSTIITSAHLLYQIHNGTVHNLKPIQFYLNLHGDTNPSIKFTIVDHRIPNEYKEIEQKISQIDRVNEPQKYQELRRLSQKYDYALLKLENHVQLPNTQSFMRMEPNFKRANQNVIVCGYYEEGKGSFYQIYHSGELKFKEKNGGGYYDIDTMRGQSGSPVYYVEKQHYYVVGIHKGHDKKLKRNVCTLIGEQMIRNLEKWQMEMNITFMKDKNIELKNIQLTEQLKKLKNQMISLNNQNLRLSKKMEESQTQKLEMLEQIKLIRQQLLQSNQRNLRLDEKMIQINKQLNEEVNRHRRDIDQKDKVIAELMNKINSHQISLTDKEKQIKKLNTDLKNSEQSVKTLEEKLTSKIKQSNKVQEKFKIQRTDISKLEDKIKHINNQNIHLKNQLKNNDKQPYDPIKFYQKVIKQKPNDAHAYLKLALAYYQAERTTEAFKHYEKALQLNKNILEDQEQVKKMFFDLANHYSEQQKFQKAIHFYKLALESHPNKILVYGRLSNAYSINSQWSEAVDTCHKAIEFNPAYYTAYDQLQRLFASKGKSESQMNKTIDFIEKIALGRNSSNRVANETVKILKDLLQNSK